MICLTTARLTPRSTKKVPSVTMKLGRPVFITRKPLRKPMARATSRDVTTETQTLTCQCDIMMPVIRPVVPVIAPADRSNSPPIISSATTTAMIEKEDEKKIQVLAPAGRAKAFVVNEKYKKMATAATRAPTSGRRRRAASRACSPTRSSRSRAGSATGGGGVAVALIEALPGAGGTGVAWDPAVLTRGRVPRSAQRVPFWAYFSTDWALSLVMMAGPEYT